MKTEEDDRKAWRVQFEKWYLDGYRRIAGFFLGRGLHLDRVDEAVRDAAAELLANEGFNEWGHPFRMFDEFRTEWLRRTGRLLSKERTIAKRHVGMTAIVEESCSSREREPLNELCEREYRDERAQTVIQERIENVLSLLQKDHRIALLTWLDVGCSFSATKAALGVADNTARGRVGRAMKDFQSEWKREYSGDSPLPTW